jgi:hypothetical protein
MQSVFERARGNEYNIGSTAPSAETFSIMQTAITGFENDEDEKEKKRIEELIKLGGTAAIEAQVERYKTLNPGASPEEVQAYRDNVTMRDDVANRMAITEVEKAELELDVLTGTQNAQEKMHEQIKLGNNSAAAAWADRAGLPDMAAMLRGDFDPEVFNAEQKLFKSFNDATKDYRKIRDAYAGLLLINENPSPAGDLATIFAFMKMLDPGSTVREGEYANAQNTGSGSDKLWNAYNQLIKGLRLGEVIYDEEGNVVSKGKLRQDFLAQAQKLYLAARESRDKNIELYTIRTNRYGLDPRQVIADDETETIFKALPKGEMSEAAKKKARNLVGDRYKVKLFSELENTSEGIGFEYGQEPPGTNSNGEDSLKLTDGTRVPITEN